MAPAVSGVMPPEASVMARPATIFTAGQRIEGFWTRPSLTSVATLTTADGRVIELLGDHSPEEAAAWLAEAAVDPERSARARGIAQERLSIDVGVERLEGVYRELFAEGSTRDRSAST